MAIEPPNPNNLPALEALRAALPALHDAARRTPADPYITNAIGHVGAALALLEAPAAPTKPRV